MTDKEIRRNLEAFVHEIFHDLHSIEDAITLKNRLDAFCKENNVTFEQRQVIADSGAGELLYMIIS